MIARVSRTKLKTLFFALFCLIIIVNPLPLGSNRVWAWSLEAFFAVLILLLLIICSRLFSSCNASWGRLKKMRLQLYLIVCWLIIILFYIVPLPLFVLNIIAPNVAKAYADLGQDFGYMTLDVYASYQFFLLSCYYTILFVLGVVLINTRKRIKVVLFLLLFMGVFEAIYGMYLVSIGQTGTLVQITSVSALHASGTFINRNHLVAFLSLCFLLGLGLRLILSRKNIHFQGVSIKERVVRYISHPIRLLDFSLFLIILGIWNTHSRAGLVSFLLSLFFYFSLLYFSQSKFKFGLKQFVFVCITSIIVLVLVSDDVKLYMNAMGQNSNDSQAYIMDSAEGRLLALEQAVDNISDYWFSGVGPGAYQVFFVNHRTQNQVAYFDHAHNDYVEFIVEFGILSCVLLFLVVYYFFNIFKSALKTTSQFYKILSISVLSVIFYMLLHGMFDFNARIPANMVTIIVAISVVYGKIITLNVKKVKK